MALPVTEKFEEMTLETSDNGTTWTKICGLVDVEITRSASVDSTEVLDCDDESLPVSVEKSVRSIEVSVSATGVWAQQSHEVLMDWFYGAASRRVRLGHTKAATGDTEYESGMAILSNLSNSRTKGQKVTASIELQFDGTPTRIAQT